MMLLLAKTLAHQHQKLYFWGSSLNTNHFLAVQLHIIINAHQPICELDDNAVKLQNMRITVLADARLRRKKELKNKSQNGSYVCFIRELYNITKKTNSLVMTYNK
jgi:hypothetical protein